MDRREYRGLRGERHRNAKLTAREVETIRKLRERGVSYIDLAESFGVTKRTVGAICRYERWTG